MGSAYAKLGGTDGVGRLVKIFYDIVESHPDGMPLVKLHNQGNGFNHGGPQLYYEHHRHSNVKRMHAHLEIGQMERDSWVNCMNMALDQIAIDKEFKEWLMSRFRHVADALINKNATES